MEREYRVLGRNPFIGFGHQPYEWLEPVLARSAHEAVKKTIARSPGTVEKDKYRLVKVVASGEIVEVEPE